ncbi:glycoside hydrolase family 3 C-terminal domain-containing protein [Allorhizocola rhizosphaerae]|uniref:glycoside hydrolase family 3 C-terminal domain-containing protein n=1 Tax=Allorhizocola rhizosphaerae TaxID=1872709 RepID=UPI0013C34A01|nr:glycoside hydrolase family 3 C-terminal domain-containing protein [Allorhizocola rhizosphaerae]
MALVYGTMLSERTRKILAEMTVDEKISLLHQHAPAIQRLGLAAFSTGSEALHGVAWLGTATVFPQAVGLGATWDRALLRRIGEVVSTEMRAFHNDPAVAGDPHRPRIVSLNVWAPVVNLLRDPRWGRNHEGYSEDPLLTAELAVAYCAGLRGEHPTVWRTAPIVKHFLAFNNETGSFHTSANVTERSLHEYDLPPFLAPLRADVAAGVMPSYNMVNGIPCHCHPWLNEVLRPAAGRQMVVVADAFAVSNMAGPQHFFDDPVRAHAAAVKAGLDCITENYTDSGPTRDALRQAYQRDLLTDADLDAAAGRMLWLRELVGEFNPDADPYQEIGPEVIASQEHGRLALQAARQSVVLLKNADHALPATGLKSIAVIGPLGGANLRDWYSGTMPYEITVAGAFAARLDASFSDGTDTVRLVAGETTLEAELEDWGNDRITLRLTGSRRYLSLDSDRILVDDQDRPGGWFVEELFRLDPVDGGYALYNHVARRWVVRAGDRLAAHGTRAEDALVFTRTVIRDGLAEAAAAAKRAELALVVLGNDPHINGRELEDRSTLDLPSRQEALLRTVLAANPRTVLLIVSGHPYAANWAERRVPAILWSSHGGQGLGTAIADVVLGDHNPGGRLPQTWYRSVDQLPSIFDYDIAGNRATYLYTREDVLFPFGHGLSYTSFRYDRLDVDGDRVMVTITNTGPVAGDEVVQVYSRAVSAGGVQPLRRLQAFERIHLAPGESVTVAFDIARDRLATWSATDRALVVAPGGYELMAGPSSADIRLRAPIERV